MNAAGERPRLRASAAQAKLWIEYDGRVLLSDYRVRLLEQIAETGSLSEAAQRMNLSYRRAWGKIRDVERNLGRTLVESEAGGAGGGGSRLTPAAVDLVARYRRMQARLAAELAVAFDDYFTDAPLP